jgi:putative thioredoxin
MQPIFNAPNGTGDQAAELIKDGTDRSFMADVVEASRSVPVIVDFWAPWCGPCKQLGPILEKVVKGARGAVRLVKIDTDKNPQIAGQLRVQSIPAVYAFFQGRPVDAFTGAQPESQIKSWVERLVQLAGGAGGDAGGLEEALDAARQALEQGDAETAAAVYSEILQAEPESGPAYAGLARALIALDRAEDARRMLDQPPPALAKDKDVLAARAALDLLEQSQAAGPVPELMDRVAREPDDHQARFDLALALFAQNRREEAVDQLLEAVRRDREWNDQAARKQLVKFFEAFGPTDKLTVSARRRLSSILFS